MSIQYKTGESAVQQGSLTASVRNELNAELACRLRCITSHHFQSSLKRTPASCDQTAICMEKCDIHTLNHFHAVQTLKTCSEKKQNKTFSISKSLCVHCIFTGNGRTLVSSFLKRPLKKSGLVPQGDDEKI